MMNQQDVNIQETWAVGTGFICPWLWACNFWALIGVMCRQGTLSDKLFLLGRAQELDFAIRHQALWCAIGRIWKVFVVSQNHMSLCQWDWHKGSRSTSSAYMVFYSLNFYESHDYETSGFDKRCGFRSRRKMGALNPEHEWKNRKSALWCHVLCSLQRAGCFAVHIHDYLHVYLAGNWELCLSASCC